MKAWTLFLLLLLSFGTFVHAQRTYGGFFPEMAVNKKMGQHWKLTGKIESQHIVFYDDVSHPLDLSYRHYRTDLQFFTARNIRARTNAAIGYQYRFEGEGENSHRTIQQIGWLTNWRHYRFGHRVRADQTFFDEGVSWRMRYRISSDIPVNGQKLDPGENYLIVSNEIIADYFVDAFDLENRIVAGVGWYFQNKDKLEVSLDYRLDPIVKSPQRNRFWLKFSFYLNI
jgi:hypothetical protein